MSREKNLTRDLTLAGLMVAVGFVLHGFFPAIVAGMKPDFSLIMLILFALLRRDRKITIAAGVATAIITALTTTFPGGQLPNIIDKLLTTAVVLGLTMFAEGYYNAIITGIIGTIVSGVTFLTSALLISGLPAPYKVLFFSVVLPATALNTVAIAVLYPVVVKLNQMIKPRTATASRTTKVA